MALENILSQEIVQKLGWTLLHFVWQAAAVALLLAILLALLRKAAANVRYIVACAALGLIVLLPIVTIQLVPVSTPQPIAGIEPTPAPVILPAQEFREIPAVEMTIPEGPVQYENAGPAYKDSWKQQAADLLEPALPYIVSVWLLGVFGLSLWHLGGWTQLQRLRKKMVRQVDESLYAKLRRLSQRLRVKRAVQLAESAMVQVPTVIGWLRPIILLPASTLTGLTSEQLEALLAHELAHIRRYDYLFNIIQTIVETLGFYHPAVWWVSHKIRIERENCCDDLAVSISGDRIRYARALTSMEEIRGRRGELAVAASGGNLFGRIHRLIDKESTESSRTSWIPSAITILLIAIMVIPTTLALTGQNKTQPTAEFLLNKMLEHRSRVKNLQYVAENNIWRDAAAEKDRIEDQIKSMRESGMSERQLERFRQSRTEAPESRYQILRCTIDDEERVKIEQTGGTYDSSGKKVPRGDKHIWAWNGILATELHQSSGLPASATIRDMPQMATRLGHPWKSFTGIFCGLLGETIAAEIPVSVEKLEDNTCRIAFDYQTSRIVAIVDSSQGYTCALRENYYNGQLNSRSTAKYEEVTKGIWFPISGQREEYTPNGSVRRKSTVISSQTRINDPAFNENYFDVDMPEGTAVRDNMQGKQYVVGSKRVYDLNEPQKPSAETEEIDPNSWQEKFYSIYRLEDDQILKRIAPPFIPERKDYYFNEESQQASIISEPPDRFIFHWDRKLKKWGYGFINTPDIDSTLRGVLRMNTFEYDGPDELLSLKLPGDWIVRDEAPQEEKLKALEQLLTDELVRFIRFEKRIVEQEIIVATGRYKFHPVPEAQQQNTVHLYVDELSMSGGGTAHSVAELLQKIGNRANIYVVDRTEPSEENNIPYYLHRSSRELRQMKSSPEKTGKLKTFLANLTKQTELQFEVALQPVEKWFISENGTIKVTQKAGITASDVESGARANIFDPSEPVVAKSAAPSGVDKTIVRIDLSVVEVISDLKMDREMTIAARNLLGPTFGSSTDAVDLLRKAADTTAALEGESGSDKRVTQEMFKVLVDMMTSKGYVKILMCPTLEVVDGQTAKITGTQDSIQITPNVLEDGNIILQVEAALSSESIRRDNEQAPITNKLEISTQIRLSPGESGIISGIKQAGLLTEPDKAAKELEVPASEILVILTPTIVETASNQQNGIDIKDQATVNKESEVVLIRYADVMEVAEHINKVLQQPPEKELRERVHIQPLERTRQIIIFGRPDMRQMVKKLIAEIDMQVEHSKKLSKLGKALLIYTNDHDGKYPDSVAQVKPYLKTEEFAWAQQNVTYYGKGRTVADPQDMWLARDNRQAAATKGTNILFNDGRVEFIKPGKQKDRGIGKDQIMIDIKILTVSDDFLKYIGLDPNSAVRSEGWSNYRVHTTEDSVSFVIDQLHEDLLLGTVAARIRVDKDIRMFHPLPVLAKSGKKCEIQIIDSEHYRLTSPPESKSNRIELGTTIRLKPTLIQKGQNVELDFEWEYRRLRGVKEHTGPDGKVQKFPQIDIDSIQTPCTIPDDKTLLIAGKKITEQKKKEPRKFGLADLPLIGGLFNSPTKNGETGNLLILIKPNINPPKKAPPKLQPIDPNDPLIKPIDPNDPLIKQLEEKFKRSDEQK